MQNVADFRPPAEHPPFALKTVTLEYGPELIGSKGSTFDQLQDPHKVFWPADFQGYRDEVLGSKDASMDRAFARQFEFDVFGFSQCIPLKVIRHRQELDRQIFDQDPFFTVFSMASVL